jgi:xanthine/uracil permease
VEQRLAALSVAAQIEGRTKAPDDLITVELGSVKGKGTTITLKLPPSTVERLREYARSSGLTIGAIVTVALNAFLRALKKHG